MQGPTITKYGCSYHIGNPRGQLSGLSVGSISTLGSPSTPHNPKGLPFGHDIRILQSAMSVRGCTVMYIRNNLQICSNVIYPELLHAAMGDFGLFYMTAQNLELHFVPSGCTVNFS